MHGAFADGSAWDKVIPLLQSRELKVVSVRNPLSSLAEDVAATRRALDLQQVADAIYAAAVYQAK